MKTYLAAAALGLLGMAGSASAAWTYCPSNHRTGYVYFDAAQERAEVYMDGRGQWHDRTPVRLDIPCWRERDTGRESWECRELGPFAHPDGQTVVSITVSYEYYLMVATRKSARYRADIVVDDFTCYW